MHQQVYNSTIVRSAHTLYVFFIYLRTNSDLCHLQHTLIGFYNREEKCLQRGTNLNSHYSISLHNSKRLVCTMQYVFSVK